MISDKSRIRQSFSAACNTYDNVAELQRTVGKSLLHTIDTTQLAGALLDVGCGTGFLSAELLKITPCDTLRSIIALDIALPMLQTARNKLTGQHKINYLCADVEQLPLADQSIDAAFSNLALQWCSHPGRAFADIKRVLKPDGQLIFSTFGPKTLQELKTAWATVDNHNHVNEFYGEQQLAYFLKQAGFKPMRIESAIYTPRYDSVLALMHELKNLGAQHVAAGRNQRITGKSQMQRMISAYEQHRSDNRIPATFEVILLSAKS